MLGRLGLLSDQQVEGFPRGAIHADLTKGLPFGPGTARYIYSSHMIEHLSRWQALRLLTECYDALAPGGCARIAVPDLRAAAEAYLSGDTSRADSSADSFMTVVNPRTELDGSRLKRYLWRNVSGAQHQWMYDAESLSLLFHEAGFTSPEVKGYLDSRLPDLELLEHRPDSVFVEAGK